MYGGTANDCTFSANYGYNGGGIQSANANRCIISGNNAPVGGGTVGGILNDCTITNNYASAYGGGIYGSTANRCTIRNNTSGNRGGGMDNGVANNCLIINNTAYNNGGGIYESTANNCTIRGNTADENGGGSYDSTLKNSIVWYNSAPVGNDIWLGDPEYSYGSSSYTCSPDVTHNQNGNTTATPLFIDNYHPAFNSPTLNVGNNSGVAATDFDGRPRMVNGTVDMGACEYDAALYDSNTDGIPDSWGIQYFGSATGGLASANGDADPADNGNEYVAGTDPTNAASFFHVTSQAAVPGGFVVNWDAVPGRVYNVHWTDSLTNGFQSVESSIPYPQNSYTDTVHTAEANSFYELEVAQAE
jgi:parallel beta-helix repeat protein